MSCCLAGLPFLLASYHVVRGTREKKCGFEIKKTSVSWGPWLGLMAVFLSYLTSLIENSMASVPAHGSVHDCDVIHDWLCFTCSLRSDHP